MNSDPPRVVPHRQPGDPVNCSHCGKPVDLLNVIARLGDRPTCRIFGCAACSRLEWVYEKA
jgi:hypothetical protein